MATLVYCCGAECGVNDSNSSVHAALVGAGATYDTSFVRSGSRSFKLNPSAATAYFILAQGTAVPFTSAGHILVVRFFMNVTVNPNSNIFIGSFTNSTNKAGLRFNTSDSKWYAVAGTTLGAVGATINLNDWVRVDIKVNTSANPWLVDAQINGVALSQASQAIAAVETAGNGFRIGDDTTTTTMTINIDDVAGSVTSADYPLGDGFVIGFSPNADGTHTATTTTIVKGTLAAPTAGGNVAGSTDTFNWVNDKPLLGGLTDNTRLINQQTAGAGLYAEWQFEDYNGFLPPRSLEVIVAELQAATQTCNWQSKLNDNGTEDVVSNRGTVAGSLTTQYVCKHYATMVGGGNWTLTRFNGLRFRFGYSSDATPDVYCRGVIIEAEFPPDIGNALFGRPQGQFGQQQMKQLLAL